MLDAAQGEPVAILKRSRVVAYLVAAERTGEEAGHRVATEEVMDSIARRRAINQPVLDRLRGK